MKSWWIAVTAVVVAGLVVALVVQLRQHPSWANPVETGAATAAALFTALAAFGSYRSAKISAIAARDARSALALHHPPAFGFTANSLGDDGVRLQIYLANGGKDLVASWTDKDGKPGASSLPDGGGSLTLPTVRVVNMANAEQGYYFTSVDAQRLEFRFRDEATNSQWQSLMVSQPAAGGLLLDPPVPSLVS